MSSSPKRRRHNWFAMNKINETSMSNSKTILKPTDIALGLAFFVLLAIVVCCSAYALNWLVDFLELKRV